LPEPTVHFPRTDTSRAPSGLVVTAGT
jgi:hypothetical protein